MWCSFSTRARWACSFAVRCSCSARATLTSHARQAFFSFWYRCPSAASATGRVIALAAHCSCSECAAAASCVRCALSRSCCCCLAHAFASFFYAASAADLSCSACSAMEGGPTGGFSFWCRGTAPEGEADSEEELRRVDSLPHCQSIEGAWGQGL